MIASGGGVNIVSAEKHCADLEGDKNATCRQFVEKCNEQEEAGKSSFKLKACDGTELIYKSYKKCVDVVKSVVDVFGTCPEKKSEREVELIEHPKQYFPEYFAGDKQEKAFELQKSKFISIVSDNKNLPNITLNMMFEDQNGIRAIYTVDLNIDLDRISRMSTEDQLGEVLKLAKVTKGAYFYKSSPDEKKKIDDISPKDVANILGKVRDFMASVKTNLKVSIDSGMAGDAFAKIRCSPDDKPYKLFGRKDFESIREDVEAFGYIMSGRGKYSPVNCPELVVHMQNAGESLYFGWDLSEKSELAELLGLQSNLKNLDFYLTRDGVDIFVMDTPKGIGN